MNSGEANIWQPRTIIEVKADTKMVTQPLTALTNQTLFTITDFAYTVGTGALQVYRNGEYLTPNVDFVEQTDTTFTVVVPSTAGDEIVAVGNTGISGTVDVRDTDIYLANYQALRDYAGAEVTIYTQGAVTGGDKGETFFQKLTGAAPGTYVDDNYSIIVPTGGDGSTGWVNSKAEVLFNTVALMEAASLPIGLRARTNSYDAPVVILANPYSGGASYLTVAAQAFDGYADHEQANGHISVLQIEDGRANVLQIGAKGNGANDDADALEAASAYAEANGLDLFAPKTANSYAVSRMITLSGQINIEFRGKIVYTGSANESAVEVGVQGSQIYNQVLYFLEISRSNLSDWTNNAVVGLLTWSLNTSKLTIERVDGFTIGYQHTAWGSSGAHYNEIYLGLLYRNRYGIRLYSILDGANENSVNENDYYGGRFTNPSGYHPTIDRYGVWMDNSEVPRSINNNVFYKPAFELIKESGSEAIPFLLHNATRNRCYSARNEGNSDAWVVIEDSGEANSDWGNDFHFGFTEQEIESDYSDQQHLSDSSAHGENIVRSGTYSHYEERALQTYLSGNLANHAVEFDGAGKIYVGGCFTSGSGTVVPAYGNANLSLGSDYVSLDVSTNSVLVGVRVDCSSVKEFMVKTSFKDDKAPQLVIVGLDSSGTQIVPTVTPFIQSRSLSTSSGFGGVYASGASNEGRTTFLKVTDPSVAHIYVMYRSNSVGDARLQGFSIATPSLNPLVVDVPPAVNQSRKGVLLATAVPTGTAAPYGAGMFVQDQTPVSGQPMGWSFTGSAWVTMANFA